MLETYKSTKVELGERGACDDVDVEVVSALIRSTRSCFNECVAHEGIDVEVLDRLLTVIVNATITCDQSLTS